MKTPRSIAASLILMLIVAGCQQESTVLQTSDIDLDAEAPTTAGLTYRYIGYSADGRAIVAGTLTLVPVRDNRFVGEWQLRALVDPNRIGPQVGNGQLTGETHDGLVHINLNPDMADNNVLLRGRLSRSQFVGRWEWVGFAGPITHGSFVASRRSADALDVR